MQAIVAAQTFALLFAVFNMANASGLHDPDVDVVVTVDVALTVDVPPPSLPELPHDTTRQDRNKPRNNQENEKLIFMPISTPHPPKWAPPHPYPLHSAEWRGRSIAW